MNERTVARFWAKVNKNGPIPAHRPELGPCWLWKPLGSTHGYGQFYDGKPQLVHRWSYAHFVKSIPPKYDVDHLCRVRNCVRPDHLEAIPHAENVRRAREAGTLVPHQRSWTHCVHGHPLSGRNLRITPAGRRACRACAREQMAGRRAAFRTANPLPPRKLKDLCANGHPYADFAAFRPDGRRYCGECAREKVRRFRARQQQQYPKAPRLACKNGHPWVRENIYVNPRTGQRACRPCHNERTLARYHRLRAEAPPNPPAPPRETCKNGHPWTPENIFLTAEGYERCRECARESNRKHEAKKRDARPPKKPRTHCRNGHELTGDNAQVSADGRVRCRACAAASRERQRNGTAVRNPAKGRKPQTHCKHGHEMTPENTYTAPNGARKCRQCLNRRVREQARKKRAAAKAAGVETLF